MIERCRNEVPIRLMSRCLKRAALALSYQLFGARVAARSRLQDLTQCGLLCGVG